MKIRNVHPCGDIVVLIPGSERGQFEAKAGAEIDVTDAEAMVLLATPGNFEAVKKEK